VENSYDKVRFVLIITNNIQRICEESSSLADFLAVGIQMMLVPISCGIKTRAYSGCRLNAISNFPN